MSFVFPSFFCFFPVERSCVAFCFFFSTHHRDVILCLSSFLSPVAVLLFLFFHAHVYQIIPLFRKIPAPTSPVRSRAQHPRAAQARRKALRLSASTMPPMILLLLLLPPPPAAARAATAAAVPPKALYPQTKTRAAAVRRTARVQRLRRVLQSTALTAAPPCPRGTLPLQAAAVFKAAAAAAAAAAV